MINIGLVGYGRTGKVVADEIYRQKSATLVSIFKKTKDQFIGQPHQTLTITHESIDRHAFGKGALKAAKFILGKTGLFTMVDVLQL